MKTQSSVPSLDVATRSVPLSHTPSTAHGTFPSLNDRTSTVFSQLLSDHPSGLLLQAPRLQPSTPQLPAPPQHLTSQPAASIPSASGAGAGPGYAPASTSTAPGTAAPASRAAPRGPMGPAECTALQEFHRQLAAAGLEVLGRCDGRQVAQVGRLWWAAPWVEPPECCCPA